MVVEKIMSPISYPLDLAIRAKAALNYFIQNPDPETIARESLRYLRGIF